MAVQCFQKRNSVPPACGVHGVLLVRERVSIDPNAAHLGTVTCLKCPVSEAIISDGADSSMQWPR
jgi:hypothetical protein